ncbi:MAG TPA: hypothetical protein ENH99_01525 [Candidatus Pacearchaeota archaeon]|nr:hypothetical protein [Candidatus Pacearchaeota archaeon]
MDKATLNLFNAIQTDNKKKSENTLLMETVKHGFVWTREVAYIADEKLIETISDVVGISGEKANNAFHKSWKIIENTPQEALVLQAILHYMTTYGFEALGMYSNEAIYIPNEKLEIPEITDDLKLVVIKGLTAKEIMAAIIELGSGIALKEETLKDIMTIIEHNKYDASLIESIKNRELRARLYDFFDLAPQDPLEYLRYLVSKLTEESLLIKNNFLIEKIKECNTTLHQRTLEKELAKAPANLAEIFFRYKPIFLAFKTISKDKTFFNQLRKKANKLHKPLPEDYLNNVTSKIKHGKKVDTLTLREELEKVNIFRKIRLAYALKFRTKDNSSIVYRIRNGRGFATEFGFNRQKEAEKVLKIVTEAIEGDLNDIKGKTIYIPDNINYALPSTEKQFTGNFPTGSYVSVPKDMVVGIHWENTGKIVDLDLSTVSASGKTGWDSYYKTEGDKILFSGDITSAPKPKGASEFFYIKEGETEHKIMMVNYYNFKKGDEVITKIIVAHEEPNNFEKDYMVDINNIIATANMNITKKQNILGLIVRVNNENRFYFAGVSVGNSITSSYRNEHSTYAREYLVSSLVDTLDFKEILEGAGAKVVSKKPKKDFIDLSPEALDKTTIINLITK